MEKWTPNLGERNFSYFWTFTNWLCPSCAPSLHCAYTGVQTGCLGGQAWIESWPLHKPDTGWSLSSLVKVCPVFKFVCYKLKKKKKLDTNILNSGKVAIHEVFLMKNVILFLIELKNRLVFRYILYLSQICPHSLKEIYKQYNQLLYCPVRISSLHPDNPRQYNY